MASLRIACLIPPGSGLSRSPLGRDFRSSGSVALPRGDELGKAALRSTAGAACAEMLKRERADLDFAKFVCIFVVRTEAARANVAPSVLALCRLGALFPLAVRILGRK